MSTFRATNTVTGEVVEYEAAQPQTIHRSPPWRLEQVFLAPPSPDAPPPVPPEYRITKFAFRARFSQAEKVGIEIAALDDPAAPMEQRAMAAALRASQDDIAVAQFVNLGLEATRNGVLALEAVGLLTPGRALEILDTPPTDDEVWNG